MALSLTACDNADNNSGNISSNSSESGGSSFSTDGTSSAEQNDPVGGDNSNVPDTPYEPPKLKALKTSYDNSCCTDDGMYYFQENYFSGGNGYFNLMYIDTATKQEVYVCSDSSCTHNNILCSSVFAQSDFGTGSMRLYAYGDKLYLLADLSYSGGFSTLAPNNIITYTPRVYRMDLDGSNREKIFTFDKEQLPEECMIGDGDNLWFSVYEETLETNEELGTYYKGRKNKCMVKLSLSERKIVEQIPIADIDKVELEFADCIGNKMLFTGNKYPNGMSYREYMEYTWEMHDPFSPPSQEDRELYEQIRIGYFTLDVETKVVKKNYLTENTNDKRYFFYDGALCVYDEAKTVRIDLGTGKTEELTVPEGYAPYNMTFDGKFMCYETAADRDWTTFYIDPDTGEFLPSRDWQGAPNDYVSSDCVCGDKVLICTGYYRGWAEIPGGGKGRTHYNMYALMSLEDYNNRIYNIEPIKMIHEGEGEYYDFGA